MSSVTLSRLICPLNVSQFSHLVNFVARDKSYSDGHANVSVRETTEKFLVYATRGTCCLLVPRMFSHPGRHVDQNVACDMYPSLTIAQVRVVQSNVCTRRLQANILRYSEEGQAKQAFKYVQNVSAVSLFLLCFEHQSARAIQGYQQTVASQRRMRSSCYSYT